MADQTGRLRCQAGCWIAASVIGLLATIISALTIEISVTGAIFVGVLAAAALGVVLSLLLCQPMLPPMAAGTAPIVRRTKPAAPAAPPVPAPQPAAPEADASKGDESPSGPVAAASIVDAGADAVASTAEEPAVGETPPAMAIAETPEAAPAEPDEADKPAALDAPREGGADDLKQIKGVGPKLEKLLNSMGFHHFDQVAVWTDREIAWVDANLEGFKGRATRDDWVGQARTLADGGSTEFSNKVKDGNVY